MRKISGISLTTASKLRAGILLRTSIGISVALLASGLLGVSTNPAHGASKTVEWFQYFNPKPQKASLNEGQDRVIKKRNFKIDENTDIDGVLNRDIGLFAIVTKEQLVDTELLKGLLANPKLAGISALISWSDLEPSEGQYNWKILDDALSTCHDNGKYLILRVSTCGIDAGNQTGDSDTPKWVFDANIKSLPYTSADGKARRMPIFWDTTYLAKWANFVKAMGEKYDKNPSLHSIGITGSGVLGGSAVVPDFLHTKQNYDSLEHTLTSEHKMSQRQLVEQWKYVADLFPKAFATARLNFDIDPPTPNRAGQDTLDEISDYLVYRYGERIFITRQNVVDGKHGFDQYRVILKLKSDTYTGYAVTGKVSPEEFSKLVKNSLNDGVSYMEIPADLFADKNEVIQTSLDKLRDHLGYQIACQKVSIPSQIKAGGAVKATLTFANLGSSTPKRPTRQLDKDVPSSYQVAMALKNDAGKAVVLSMATPAEPTTNWVAGKPIVFTSDFGTPEKLTPGNYTVWLSLINKETKERLSLIDARFEHSEQQENKNSTTGEKSELFVSKLKVD